MTVPDFLAAKLALFEEAAIIVRDEGELFTEEAWGQVMIGQGLRPRSFSPMAAAVDGKELAGFMSTLTDSYRRAAQSLPTHAQFVDTMIARAPRRSEAHA
jgi:tryptophan halogenase